MQTLGKFPSSNLWLQEDHIKTYILWYIFNKFMRGTLYFNIISIKRTTLKHKSIIYLELMIWWIKITLWRRALHDAQKYILFTSQFVFTKNWTHPFNNSSATELFFQRCECDFIPNVELKQSLGIMWCDNATGDAVSQC